MKIGEVGLLTNDVVRLANFYKKLLKIDNGSDDEVHQVIISEETMLTVYNDGYQLFFSCVQSCCFFLSSTILPNHSTILGS